MPTDGSGHVRRSVVIVVCLSGLPSKLVSVDPTTNRVFQFVVLELNNFPRGTDK